MVGKKSLGAVLLGLFAAALLVASQETAPMTDEAMRAYLKEATGQRGMMNVPVADGEFLHDFVAERGYRRGLEIGTSNGVSAMWMAMALRKKGGKLITLEINAERAALARQNFKKTGLIEVIELREGNALEIIPKLEGPFDFVFIDAWKPDYYKYFQMVYPKIRSGGAILAHNVSTMNDEMKDFLDAIHNHPNLETHIERRSRQGISVSIKKGD